MTSVFTFKDYRLYLIDRLGASGTRTGRRQKAAKVLGCHNTYLSQVLSGKIQLSVEYAEALNDFFTHSESEAEFFILLVLFSRAGTRSLKKRFEDQIKQMLVKRLVVKERIGASGQISVADRERFYSHWIYSALHVLVSIERLQTLDALAKATGFQEGRIKEELEFLSGIGLVKVEKNRYKIGPKSIHVDADSPAVTKHHANWRYHTIQNLFTPKPDDLHFSAAVTLSAQAVTEVREALLKNLERNLAVITKANEEVAYVLNFDFYRLA